MTENKTSIARDLFPRVLGMALLALTAWIATSFIDQIDQDKWFNKLKTANTKAIRSLGDTLEVRLETAQKLAFDQRLNPLFSDDFFLGDKPPKISRRAVYEFKYVNDVDHVYIFSSIYGEVLLTSAGSPPLPSRTLQPFYKAAKNKLNRLTNIVLIGGQSYLLLANAIRSPTGKIVGYAIYTDATRNFFRDISLKLRPYANIKFNAYMLEDDSAISIENFTVVASSMRMINKGKEIFPIFDTYFKPQPFTNEKNDTVLATGGFLTEIPKWKITSAIDEAIVNTASHEKRNMLFSAFFFGIITLLLIPLQGPYSANLRQVYQKLGFIKTDRSTPSIDLSSLERMRRTDASVEKASDLRIADKLRQEELKHKATVKEDYRPSDAVIAYNIRTGMKNKRIKLLYQPIFDTVSNKTAMHEVFLRIIDDEGKIMPPSLWLPVAKSENLFSLIDETVVAVAVEKFFIRPNPLKTPLAFNISGNTFSSLEFLEQLMSSSSSAYPIAQNTIFELHSKEIIEDKRAMSFIKECREMGFRFSIDYFGGGPQTLKAAKTLKFDYVKLDILKFDLNKESDQKEFIKLVKTAEAIDLLLVVEKIEDERILRFCKKVGVPFVQGYHLAEPSPELYKDV